MNSFNLDFYKDLFKEQKETILGDFFTFLKFSSISTDPAYRSEVLACCKWVQSFLEKLPFKVERWETEGFPVIFANYQSHVENAPTILIYNHYDVQPVDPLHLWDSPPFEPTLKDGKVYARGASDNKGQCLYVLQALKMALQTNSKLPLNIKLLIEGEEEVGSSSLAKILKEKQQAIQADYLFVVDTSIPHPNQPAVTLGARGITHTSFTIKGSNTDLHSGSHGGIVMNPLHALVKILASLRDDQGKVTLPGFYEEVIELTKEEKKAINFDFDVKEYEATYQAKPTGGEKSYSPMQSATIRPTLEINGLSGGYTGKGFKTVIPQEALAKVSCRLVPNQDPKKILNALQDYIKKNLPEGMEVTFEPDKNPARAFRCPPKSPVVEVASKAFEKVFQRPCHKILCGGSVPIVAELQIASKAQTIGLGLALDTDKFHAPNEHFSLDRLEKGIYVMLQLFHELANMKR